MAKNYEMKFKIEPLDDENSDSINYIVFRKNFFGKFNKVAIAKVYPAERLTINFSRNVSVSEKNYLEKYFLKLIHIRFELNKDRLSYSVFKENSRVAFTTGYELTATENLSPVETSFLSRYFRKLLKTQSIL